MSWLRNTLIASTAAAVLLGGQGIVAQPDTSDGDKPKENLPEVTAPAAKISPDKMRENAGQMMDELREMLGRFVELRKFARQSKDVIKLNCVNDKMLLFKQLVNVAEEAQTNLAESIAAGDEPARYHFYGQIVLSKEKGGGFRSEAEGCIGAEINFLGPTQVKVEGPAVIDLIAPREWFELDDPKFATPFN
jgi:hypothetical protein